MNKKLGILFAVCFILVLVYGASSFFLGHSDHEPRANHVHSEEEVYTCPMHPEIRQNKSGSCPICHMKLVKVENENANNGTLNAKSKTTLNISPYQASLVGIEPIEVKKKVVTYNLPVSGRMISRSTLAIQIFERDLRYVKPGVKFFGQSEVFPEDVIKGHVSSVDSMADPSSRTIRVIGNITEGGRNSLSESSFTGQININLGENLVVPEKSILFTGQGSFVYRYDKDQLQAQKVSLGARVGEEYVILKGLKEKDLISSGPNFLIDSESKIRGLSTQESSPACPEGQKWNAPMAMCMASESL